MRLLQQIRRCGAAALAAVALAAPVAANTAAWPLWSAYSARFITPEGRVLDPQGGDRTTSEGQAYGLFFALAANDRDTFDRLLRWTEMHLAQGDLATRLPGWLWAKDDYGKWGLRDSNAASDADVWIAYTLLEAGSLWNAPALSRLGVRLADRIVTREVRNLPGLGPMLLPGPKGFRPAPDVWQLNPSYLALQPLLGLASRLPDGPWSRIAAVAPRVILASRLHGFAADWVAFRNERGFGFQPLPRPEAAASYDAIRVYLWTGMLAEESKGRDELLKGLAKMRQYVADHRLPPAIVAADGVVKDANGSIGFSAAVLPFLLAHGDEQSSQTQRARLAAAFLPDTGLYSNEPLYYDHNLILFALGWSERRFSFEPNGRLQAPWRMER